MAEKVLNAACNRAIICGGQVSDFQFTPTVVRPFIAYIADCFGMINHATQ